MPTTDRGCVPAAPLTGPLGFANGALCSPAAVWAQPAAKVVRIGWLGDDPATTHFREAFRQGLHDLGYVEGRNFVSNTDSSRESSSGFPLSRPN